ncbi:hypothetical protein CVT26_016221 [Gymnopilus dilepis]|uniref:F-box domain-containing protein n=1 Tax=Gymnopilus dilepis TaxID=231916 RepID=A0A409WAA2_9AGAR|nr:hypothetical protein CVT26_016221 [Gymnopilus dilepis]
MLPPELEEEILSHLWNDTKALKSCALTRRSFRNPAQKLLYSEISLWFFSLEESTTSTLVDILDANPQLRHYVRRLEIIDSFREWLLNDSFILRVLLLLDNLQALVIESRPEDDSRYEDIAWPDSFLYTFLTIIHRSSLESLSMTDLPLELIKHGQHLTHLAVRQLSSQSLPAGSCTSCTEKLGLDTLDLPGFISPELVQLLPDVIQTERIRNLQAYTSGEIEEHHALWEILRPCAGRLKTLAFAPCEESDDYSAKEDPIVWSAFTSLRCLAIRVDFATGHADKEYEWPQRWEEFECYTWMFKVLDQLSSSNQCLEEIFLFLHFNIGKEIHYGDACYLWSKSIALVLDKSRFPCLKRLDAYFIDSTWFMNEFLLDCTKQLKHSQSQVNIQLYEFHSKFRRVSSDFMWSEVLPMLAWGDSSIDDI